MIPDHTTIQVRSSWQGRAGIGRSSWKGLTRDAARRLRFVVNAAGWLHSMVIHGRKSQLINGFGGRGVGRDGGGDAMHAGQSQWVWSHIGRCRSISRVRGDTLMTPDHTTVLVHGSGQGRAGIGRSSLDGLSTRRHERLQVVVHAAG